MKKSYLFNFSLRHLLAGTEYKFTHVSSADPASILLPLIFSVSYSVNTCILKFIFPKNDEWIYQDFYHLSIHVLKGGVRVKVSAKIVILLFVNSYKLQCCEFESQNGTGPLVLSCEEAVQVASGVLLGCLYVSEIMHGRSPLLQAQMGIGGLSSLLTLESRNMIYTVLI
jgi:hypothetical protein